MGDTLHRYDSFRKQLEAFTCELPQVQEGSVAALHRARVASRRLREWLPLLELDGETSRKLNRRLRKVTRRFGAVRELDVLAVLIDELEKTGRYSPTTLKQVGAAVEPARAAARERLATRLPAAKLKRLTEKLGHAAKHLVSNDARSRPGANGSRQAWRWALEARLARRAADVHAVIEAAGALYAPEHLHDVRIALKKLRYAAELSRETKRDRAAADIAALKSAQDLLGRLHDLEVLLERARQVQALLLPPDLTAWRELGRLAHAVEDDCRQLHARYMRDRARLIAIADRMGAHRPYAASIDHRAAG